MHSSIASVINSVLEFRSTLFLFFVMSDITLSFWLGIAVIFQVTSVLLFLVQGNATVTAYLLESSLAWFKKCRLLFYNYCVFARVEIENSNIMPLLSSLFVSSSMKESPKFIFSRNFPTLVTCKTSKFVTKETSLILPQTLKPPINFISRWGDSLTDVGYNFGQVKISTFNTFCWNVPQLYYSIALCISWCGFIVYTNSASNRIRTHYSMIWHDYLIIRLVLVYRWNENLHFE